MHGAWGRRSTEARLRRSLRQRLDQLAREGGPVPWARTDGTREGLSLLLSAKWPLFRPLEKATGAMQTDPSPNLRKCLQVPRLAPSRGPSLARRNLSALDKVRPCWSILVAVCEASKDSCTVCFFSFLWQSQRRPACYTLVFGFLVSACAVVLCHSWHVICTALRRLPICP